MSEEQSHHKYPYMDLGVLLSGPQLTAFGAYIFRCSFLEYQAEEIIRVLGDFRDDFPEAHDAFVIGMPFEAKRNVIKRLAADAFPKDDRFLGKVANYCSQAACVTSLRNDIVHAHWKTIVNQEHFYEPLAVATLKKRNRGKIELKKHELKTANLEKLIRDSLVVSKLGAKIIPEARQLHEQRRAALQPNTP